MKLKYQSYCSLVQADNLFWWLRKGGTATCVRSKSRQIMEHLSNRMRVWSWDWMIASLCVMSLSHEVLPLAVNEGAQSKAAPPGGRKVGHIHSPVALGLLLTPQQQPAGTHLWLWNQYTPSLGALQWIVFQSFQYTCIHSKFCIMYSDATIT